MNIAWALAQLTILHAPLLTAISSAAIPILSDAFPQDLSFIAWSYAVLAFRIDETFLHAIAAEAVRPISSFSAQFLANISWAMESLRYPDAMHRILLGAEVHICAMAPHANGLEIVDLASSAHNVGLEGIEAQLFSHIIPSTVGHLAYVAQCSAQPADITELQRFVLDKQLPHLGPTGTRRSLGSLGVVGSSCLWTTWVQDARHECQDFRF